MLISPLIKIKEIIGVNAKLLFLKVSTNTVFLGGGEGRGGQSFAADMSTYNKGCCSLLTPSFISKTCLSMYVFVKKCLCLLEHGGKNLHS